MLLVKPKNYKVKKLLIFFWNFFIHIRGDHSWFIFEVMQHLRKKISFVKKRNLYIPVSLLHCSHIFTLRLGCDPLPLELLDMGIYFEWKFAFPVSSPPPPCPDSLRQLLLLIVRTSYLTVVRTIVASRCWAHVKE